jgi:hypothetical protein
MRQTHSSFNKTKSIKTPLKSTRPNQLASNYIEYAPQAFQIADGTSVLPSP